VHRPTAVVYSRHMAAKKTTLKELGEMIAHVVKHMATKEDIADINIKMVTKADLAEAVEKLDDRLTAVESKIGGIHNRIDDEALKRGP
jgi:hypothetical protein